MGSQTQRPHRRGPFEFYDTNVTKTGLKPLFAGTNAIFCGANLARKVGPAEVGIPLI